MALKHKITKQEFEKLVKDIQGEYKEGETAGEYVLDVTGIETGDAAVRAKNQEKEARKKAEARVKELEGELTTVTEERDQMLSGSIPKADAEKLKNGYETKLTKLTKDRDEAISARDTQLKSLTVDSVANGIASKLFTSATLGLPHVKGRITSEFKDGKMTVVVLDKQGQPSSMTPEDLEKELANTEDFKPILLSSRASGGGASGANRGGGANTGKTIVRAEFDKLLPPEQAKFISEKGTVVDQ